MARGLRLAVDGDVWRLYRPYLFVPRTYMRIAISSQDHIEYTHRPLPRVCCGARRERESGGGARRAVSASHTSHESTRSHGDVFCLFSRVLFQCTVAIWLGSGLCLAVSRLESDSCVVGLALSTHSLSVLVPCARGRRAGPRALPPSASLRPAPAPPRAPAARRPPAPESRPQPRARERHVSSS